MKIFGIELDSRREKSETLKKIISSLHISQEEKDLYIISLDILGDEDFDVFFEKIISQVQKGSQINERSIEPLTFQFI